MFRSASYKFCLLFFWMAPLFLALGCTPSSEKSINKNTAAIKKETLASLVLGECNKENYPSGLSRNLECGELAVAENPNDLSGRKIRLNIARLPAISSRPEHDPLFIFAGGPGQAATEIISGILPLARKVNQKRDIIFVDQRGTGKSNPLDCDPKGDVDYELSYQDSLELQKDMLKECMEKYDADLSFYTTPYAMDDIDEVRQALGYEKINVWGASYGTRAALVYMRRHPDTVRTAVLDGVAPIGMNIPHHFLSDADEALSRLFDHCSNNEVCNNEFGDLKLKTKNIIKNLNEKPQTILIRHPSTQKNIDVFLNGKILASYLRLSLYSREMSSVLPLMINAIGEKDYRALSVLLSSTESAMGGMSVGMQYTVLCAEDVLPALKTVKENDKNAVHESKQESLLQLNLVEPMEEVCEFWPKGKLPEKYNSPITSDVPTLILSGELDPVTPPYWGDKAAETLVNRHHIVVPGTHHGSSFSGCVPDIVNDFINSSSLEGIDDSCVKKIKPMSPFVSAAGPVMQALLGQPDHKDEDIQKLNSLELDAGTGEAQMEKAND